ncbi:MAG: GNAT family N-acetyltransferase, partial [Planctomycetota bacterium]
MPDQRLTVRPFAEADAEAVLDLHNRVFAKARPRTRHHWHWKFRDNPLRATEVILAMRRDGRCVAQYAGIPSACVLNGERCRQSVQSDVAIDPEHRRGLQRTGLIVRMAELYLDRFGGRTNALLDGFPEPPLLRVGVRLLKFEVLRDVSFLVREASIPLVGAARGVSARRVPRFGAAVDALWERAKATITTATIRDAAYLNWRYADHPDVEHLLLEVSDDRSGELLGIAVLREGGWDDSIVSILECLVPARDRDDAERLLIR